MSTTNNDDNERERSGRGVPPGFRFHPTDEELIDFYLRKKVATSKFELDHVIPEVDLNKLEPWDLREKCKVDASHQTEWYFFSHKDKKYPTGTRTNRATKAGFWKATGRDKAVLSSHSQPRHLAGQRIGMRKTLVFYQGRAPNGLKTDWIMHEYRLQDADTSHASKLPNEDGWVVCRVFKKKNYEEKSSTSASSYNYDQANLSDEEQAPMPSTHSTTTLPEVGSSHSIVSSSKRAQRLLRKQVQDMNNSISGSNNLALFSCKQEVMGDQYEGHYHQPTTASFFQLPHLESTEKISPNYHAISNLVNNTSIVNTTQYPSHGRFEGSEKVHHLAQYANDVEEGAAIPQQASKAYFMTEEDLAHCVDNSKSSSSGQQHLADNLHCWSVFENFARLQGTELAFGNVTNEQHWSAIQLSKSPVPPDSYPSTYEIELWNFPR